MSTFEIEQELCVSSQQTRNEVTQADSHNISSIDRQVHLGSEIVARDILNEKRKSENPDLLMISSCDFNNTETSFNQASPSIMHTKHHTMKYESTIAEHPYKPEAMQVSEEKVI